MRVPLRGINRVRKKLADGSTVTYYYAWKGGPRLEGTFGSPEFHASYNRAVESRRPAVAGTVRSILDPYEASPAFSSLAPRSQSDYRKLLRIIEAEFGDFPLKAYEDRRTRGIFMAWRDRLAIKSRRQADYAFAVFARANAWAFDRGLIAINPCERAGRVYRSTRSENVWTDADEAAFYAKAPAHLHIALTLALWTGQRQGDLLKVTWGAYDGSTIRLRQRKTKVPVVIPVGAPLKAALDAAKAKLATMPEGKPRPLTILATEGGTAWTESGFRASWRKACAKAGVVGVTFHDLRGTAVTRLALAGCTTPEIATVTGHSLRDVGAILDSHYMNRDPKLAEAAVRKLERRTESPN
jgi:integrase